MKRKVSNVTDEILCAGQHLLGVLVQHEGSEDEMGEENSIRLAEKDRIGERAFHVLFES